MSAEAEVLTESHAADLLPLIFSFVPLPEFTPDTQFNLLRGQTLILKKRMRIVSRVCHAWNRAIKKIPSLWYYVIGNPAQPTGTRLVWSNRILYDIPTPVDSSLHRIVFYWYTSMFMKRWKADKTKISLAIFDATKKKEKRKIAQLFPLADYFGWMDTEAIPPQTIIDFHDPPLVKKGQYIGIIFDINATFDSLHPNAAQFPAMYFMNRTEDLSQQNGPTLAILYDHNEKTDELIPDTAHNAGFWLGLTPNFQSMQESQQATEEIEKKQTEENQDKGQKKNKCAQQ